MNAVVAGGASRTESLRAALPHLDADVDIVVTHDCVRPLASAEQVRTVVAAVRNGADAAIAAWQSPDTVKRLQRDESILILTGKTSWSHRAQARTGAQR